MLFALFHSVAQINAAPGEVDSMSLTDTNSEATNITTDSNPPTCILAPYASPRSESHLEQDLTAFLIS